MSSTSRQPDLWQKTPQLLKISSADRIEQLIRQAVPGVALTHVPAPPGAIPIKTSFHYFLLGKSGREWDAISAARNLAVYVPADYPDAQLELVILLPTQRSN
jgi:type VI secretion system protein ImpJ